MEAPPPKAFIPPQPERPQSRPRMPRIVELPVPAQNQLRARERAEPVEDPLEKPRMSLLQRLASVGLGRKESEEEPYHPQPAPPRSVQMPERPRPVQRRPEAHPQEPVSEFAKRPPSLGLDLDRPVPPNAPGDDQLDIPAFLRRQAN